MNKIILDKIAQSITDNQARRMEKDEIITISVGHKRYELHPAFLTAYYNDWMNVYNYIRRANKNHWGEGI